MEFTQNPWMWDLEVHEAAMAERGKYHGQRLKARDVLRYYAAGERDFRGAILRGCDFRDADLSGADFTRADIRSAWFVNATLRGARFCHAKAGLQRRWWWVQLALVVAIATLSGFLQGFVGYLIAVLLFDFTSTEEIAAGIAGLGIIAIVFWEIARQGFTLKTLGNVAVAVAVAVAGAVAFAGAFAGAGAVTSAVAGTGAGAGAGAFAGAFAGAGAVAGAFAVAFAGAGAGAGAVAFAGAGLLLSIYINRRIRQNDPKFENLRVIGLALTALGGTAFSGADLTAATFAHAHLKSTNFADSRQQPTTLNQVRWHNAEKLNLARLGTSNLQDPRVRTLLTTLNGIDQDLSNTDLRGVNLADAQLHRINLKGTNLNGATLQGVGLQGANLTAAQCIGTDCTAAHLTGACLEAWNIDETTILQDIDCQYVFLKETPNALGGRERLPHNPDKCFEPGDFEKYFQEVLDEVKILIRGGVDPQAFKTAFQALMQQHQITPNNVRGLQRKGADVLMTVAAPPDQPKPEIARTFDTAYEKALPATTAQALLEAERRNKQEFVEFANKSIDRISHVLSNLTINTTAMTHSHNPSITTGDGSVYAGHDVTLTGSTLNLGKISGQVSHQINQLPDAVSSSDQPSLKDLLTQLKAAIDQDTELSDDEKAEALGEVAKLTKAGSNPQVGAMQRIAKRATATLKSITEPLNEASKLASTCQSLLPMIMSLFG
ncbi:MAG: pentapeptide repeat-containing protein [Leptolyngbya sp. SIO1E4]|nr:pentapeptide repeat-containing protein [Leptolyngbya sp. SIO1E4]